MGFFKKIGNAVKKGLKQVSLKNVVKIGTPLLSMIPIVGGLAQNVVGGISASHEAKKLAEEAERAGNLELANAYNQQAATLSATSGQVVGQQAGSVLSAFAKGATGEMLATTSQGLKASAGDIGAEITDQTIKSWFTKHWKHLLIGLVALGAIFFFWKKSQDNQPRRRPYKR